MEKQNWTENKNSLFTEIELDEAVNVNGGYLGVPDYQPGGFLTYASYGSFQHNLNQYGQSNLPGYGTVYGTPISSGYGPVMRRDGLWVLPRDL